MTPTMYTRVEEIRERFIDQIESGLDIAMTRFFEQNNKQYHSDELLFYTTEWDSVDEEAEEQIGGRWSLGWNQETGVEYLFRSEYEDFRDARVKMRTENIEEEKTYIFGGYYDWQVASLVEAVSLIRTDSFEMLLDSFEEENLLENDERDIFEEACEMAVEELNEIRQNVTTERLAELFEKNDDILVQLFGTDEEAQDEIDRILYHFSKDVDSWDKRTVSWDRGENDVDVCYQDDSVMLIRSEYTEKNINWVQNEIEEKTKVYGYVAGKDDTPETLFLHRITVDSRVKDADYDWTLSEIREKMGFERDYSEDISGGLEKGTVTRIQGDVSILHQDYDEVRNEYFQDKKEEILCENLEEHTDEFFDKVVNADIYGKYNYYTGRDAISLGNIEIDTDALKEFMDEHDIPEEEIRGIQEEEGWGRLSAKKRAEAIREYYHRQFVEWYFNNNPITEEEIDEQVEEIVSQEFDADLSDEFGMPMGNHLVIVDGGRVHPQDDTNGMPIRIIVGQDTHIDLVHDEHECRSVRVERGVYKFDFLERFVGMPDWMF